MMGWAVLPMSPEKTIFFSVPPSVSHASMHALPSRWPTSVKRMMMFSPTWMRLP